MSRSFSLKTKTLLVLSSTNSFQMNIYSLLFDSGKTFLEQKPGRVYCLLNTFTYVAWLKNNCNRTALLAFFSPFDINMCAQLCVNHSAFRGAIMAHSGTSAYNDVLDAMVLSHTRCFDTPQVPGASNHLSISRCQSCTTEERPGMRVQCYFVKLNFTF